MGNMGKQELCMVTSRIPLLRIAQVERLENERLLGDFERRVGTYSPA
jgi:hypothetical protein